MSYTQSIIIVSTIFYFLGMMKQSKKENLQLAFVRSLSILRSLSVRKWLHTLQREKIWEVRCYKNQNVSMTIHRKLILSLQSMLFPIIFRTKIWDEKLKMKSHANRGRSADPKNERSSNFASRTSSLSSTSSTMSIIMGEDTQSQQMEKMHTFWMKRVPSVDSKQVESYAEFLNNWVTSPE